MSWIRLFEADTCCKSIVFMIDKCVLVLLSSFLKVIRELLKATTQFRVVALSYTAGSDIQVICVSFNFNTLLSALGVEIRLPR